MPGPGDLTPETATQAAHHALLDAAPMGRRQYGIWLLASGGTLLDGFSIFSLGVGMPLITRHFELGPVMVGLIGAALVLGAVLGAVAGGPAADRFGRKPAFLVDMAIITAGALLSAVAQSPNWLLVGQLLIGIGIGIDFPVSASYVSETMPKHARSRMVVATIALQSVGLLLAAAVAIAILREWAAPADWRILLGATGAGALLFLLLRFLLPESPRWLTEHGRSEDARRVVTGMLANAAAIARLPSVPQSAGVSQPHDGSVINAGDRFRLLFSPRYRQRTLLVCVPWFLMDVATYGVGLFTPVILGAIHISSVTGGALATDLTNAEGTAAIDLFLLIGFLVGLWAVPRFGRLHMQVAGFAGMTAGMAVLAYAVIAGGTAGIHVPIVFAGFILFNLAMNAGPNATTFSLASELFPTSVRASASGLAAATAKTGATLGIFVLPLIREHWGVAAVLVMMAAVSALGAAITTYLGRKIKEIPEGRGLDDITA